MAVWHNSEAYEFGINNNLGNFAGFIPVGFFWAAGFIRMQKLSATMTAVFLLSLVFECLQIITGLGIADIDDLILNSIGGLTGWLIFRLIFKADNSTGKRPTIK